MIRTELKRPLPPISAASEKNAHPTSGDAAAKTPESPRAPADIVEQSPPKEPGFLTKVGRGIAGFAGRVGKESLKHAALALAVPAATFAVSLVAPAAAPAVAVGLGVGAGIAHLATSPRYSAPEKDPSLSERKYKDAAVGKAILAGTTTMMLGGLGAGVLGATAPLIGVGGVALAGAGALYGAVKSIKDQVGEGLHRLGIRKNHETKETLDWLILDRKVELNEDGYYDGDFFFP